jgi:hypothetical protein
MQSQGFLAVAIEVDETGAGELWAVSVEIIQRKIMQRSPDVENYRLPVNHSTTPFSV